MSQVTMPGPKKDSMGSINQGLQLYNTVNGMVPGKGKTPGAPQEQASTPVQRRIDMLSTQNQPTKVV